MGKGVINLICGGSITLIILCMYMDWITFITITIGFVGLAMFVILIIMSVVSFFCNLLGIFWCVGIILYRVGMPDNKLKDIVLFVIEFILGVIFHIMFGFVCYLFIFERYWHELMIIIFIFEINNGFKIYYRQQPPQIQTQIYFNEERPPFELFKSKSIKGC